MISSSMVAAAVPAAVPAAQQAAGDGARAEPECGLAPALPPPAPPASVATAPPEPPDDYMCPITTDLMADPVIATDGFAYERDAIECWFATGKQTSPKTGEPLEVMLLIPCHQLRSRIREWREQPQQLG